MCGTLYVNQIEGTLGRYNSVNW